MAQVLDSIPEGRDNSILCSYINATSQIQIVRITNAPNWYFERVVFPGQRLVFETLSEALLEVHTAMMASAILSDTISCNRLRVKEDGDVGEDLIERESEFDLETRSSLANNTNNCHTATSSKATATV
jgi:hypothetical protein